MIDEIKRVLKPGGYLVLIVDIFEEEAVSDHSRYSFTKNYVHSLLDGKLRAVFERELPRIAIRSYVNGSRKSHNKELIMILQKACFFYPLDAHYRSLSPNSGYAVLDY